MTRKYYQQKLIYTDDGRLLDEMGQAIMMEWEKPIMEKSAEIICKNRGRVLNVGFGMGLIDNAIEEYPISEHWIIEPHLDVFTKMMDEGWHLKPNVRILHGDWQWFMKYLPKFDGIYIDTWDEEIHDFHRNVPNMLSPHGIYSYFNNPRGDEKGLHMTDIDYEIFKDICNIDFDEISLDQIDDVNKQTTNGDFYWHPTWKTYYCPTFTLKQDV